MTLRTQPPAAKWLVERLGPADRRESLIGDLTEHYQRGHSAFWFWRQSLMAIFVGAARDLRRDIDRVAHAVLTGLGAWLLYWQLSGALTTGLGYLAGDNHWRRDTFWQAEIAILVPLGFVGGAIAGWLVVGFHRRHLTAALLALTAIWVAIDLPNLLPLIRGMPKWWGYPDYRYQLAIHLGRLMCMVLGTAVGGLSKVTLPMNSRTLDTFVP